MTNRRKFLKRTDSLEVRLAREAKRIRQQAHHMSPGPQRENLFEKARQLDEAKSISEMLGPQKLG